MSGIVGIFDREGANPELLEKMAESIRYDKSHKVNRYLKNSVGFALVNKESYQPVFSKDKRLCILMDGEVFDYGGDKSLLEKKGYRFKTGSQAEFCLHSYEEYGEDFVRKLNGCFVIIVIEKAKNRVLIFNDRIGAKPFYYFSGSDKLLFSSEIKAILQDSSVKGEVDDEAVADFFAFEKVLKNKTLIKSVFALPHASICKIEGGEINFKKYWDMNFKEDCKDSLDYYVEKLEHFLKKAINRRFSDNIHFTLSGGLDTRLVISIANEKQRPLHTFTIGKDSYDEVKIAKSIAEKINARHSVISLDESILSESVKKGVYITDGMCNCRHFGFFSGADEIAKGRNIIISATGLGEFLGDYFVDESSFHLKNEKEIVSYCYRKFNSLIKDWEMPLLFSEKYLKKIKGLAYKSVKEEIAEAKKHATLPANILYYFLFKNSLRQVFFYSEFKGLNLNVRLPSTDIDFINFILEIPPELRVRRNLEYEIIRRKFPNLSGITYNQTGFPISYEPSFHRIGMMSWKNKKCRMILEKTSKKDRNVTFPDRIEYVDLKNELRRNNRLIGFFKEILFDKKSLIRPYFNSDYIKRLFAEHLLGKKNNTNKLCALVTFELWHRFFIDERG